MKNSILYFFLLLSIACLQMPLNAQVETRELSTVKTAPLKVEVLSVKHASCTDSEDGQVEFKITGGQAPYPYAKLIGTLKTEQIEHSTIFTKINPDAYTLQVVDAVGNKVSTPILIKATQAAPIADFEVRAVEEELEFTNTSQNSGRWNWTIGDTFQSYKIHPKGTFSKELMDVCLEASNGCNAIDVYCETVNGKQLIAMTQSISKLEKASTIQQSSTSKSIVYPNPTSNNLTIHSQSALENLSIYTTAGKRLQTIPLNSTGPFSISLRDFPAGNYIVKLVNGKESESIKVSKVE